MSRIGKEHYVNFRFQRLDPAFHALESNERLVAKQQFLSTWETFGAKMRLGAYSLVGLHADCDVLFWRVADSLEAFEAMSSRMLVAGLGKYLAPVHSYLAVTHEKPEEAAAFLKYLFVMPAVKAGDEARRAAARFPGLKLHPAYGHGLDDLDALAVCEAERAEDFLSLGLQGPTFTCLLKDVGDLADALG